MVELDDIDVVICALEKHEGAAGKEVSCVGCPYAKYGEYCLTVLHSKALGLLKVMDALREDMWDLSNENRRLKRELKAARTERDAAREKLLWLEPSRTPNDWGEYPPEFPKEGI